MPPSCNTNGRHYVPDLPPQDHSSTILIRGNLPDLPPKIIPKEGKISDKHAEEYYEWFPALDLDHDRSLGSWESRKPLSDANKLEFQQRLTALKAECIAQGLRIGRDYYAQSFKEAGIYPNRGAVASMMDMTRFIASKELKAGFELHPLIPFAFTCHLIHGTGHPKQLSKWFVPSLHQWSRTSYQPPFIFDSDGFDNKTKGSTTHNVISCALIGRRACSKTVNDAEKRAFGAYLTVKSWSDAEKKSKWEKDKAIQFEVHLGAWANPHDIKTYLCVDTRRLVHMKKDSTVEDLINGPRNPFAKLCWILCHEATKRNLTKEQAKTKLMEQLDIVYERGASTHTASTQDTGQPTTNTALTNTFDLALRSIQQAPMTVHQQPHPRQQQPPPTSYYNAPMNVYQQQLQPAGYPNARGLGQNHGYPNNGWVYPTNDSGQCNSYCETGQAEANGTNEFNGSNGTGQAKSNGPDESFDVDAFDISTVFDEALAVSPVRVRGNSLLCFAFFAVFSKW